MSNNMGSSAKFIVSDNAEVSMPTNLLNVTVFEADIKDKHAVFFFFARWQATYFLYPLLAAAPF